MRLSGTQSSIPGILRHRQTYIERWPKITQGLVHPATEGHPSPPGSQTSSLLDFAEALLFKEAAGQNNRDANKSSTLQYYL
jgi:hypothetical protein